MHPIHASVIPLSRISACCLALLLAATWAGANRNTGPHSQRHEVEKPIRREGLREERAEEDDPAEYAATLLQAAADLRKQWTADSSHAAIARYEVARQVFHASGNRRGEIAALEGSGEVSLNLGNLKEAMTSLNRALAIIRTVADAAGEAEVLNMLARLFVRDGDERKGLEYAHRALSWNSHDTRTNAEALTTMGEAYVDLGESEKALSLLKEALPVWRSLADRQGEARTLAALGDAYSGMSNPEQALDYVSRTLAISKEISDPPGQASILSCLGHLESKLGEKQKAIDLYDEALTLCRVMGDRDSEAEALTGLGFIYEELGEAERALENYNEALTIYRQLKSKWSQVLEFLVGRSYFALGETQKALQHDQEALLTYRTFGFKTLEAHVLLNIGAIYESLGDDIRARQYYQQSLRVISIRENGRNAAYSLCGMGRLDSHQERTPRALHELQQALILSRASQDKFGESQTLYALAQTNLAIHKPSEALQAISSAVEISESLRTKVASEDTRASYLASAHQFYELYIKVLMQLNGKFPEQEYGAMAFEVSERARARSLLDMLGQSRSKASPDSALMVKPASVPSLKPPTLSAREVQQNLLDDDTLLLEYSLGDDASWVWAVTRNTVAVHQIASRVEIESAAQRLYETLVARQRSSDETSEQRRARVSQADNDFWEQARVLSQILLGPVSEQLNGKRIIVVADGALQYVPFQVLPVPWTSPTASQDESHKHPEWPSGLAPLVLEHEVVDEPSASALSQLRTNRAGYHPTKGAVAVFADPVFAKDDPRVSSPGQEMANLHTRKVSELTRALDDFGVSGEAANVPRLPASREEAGAIADAAPRGATLLALGFAANLKTASQPEIGQYRIVHFATHGLVDDEHPNLSGIVLSLVNEKGEPQDGFLRLQDIYRLNLPVDLVVLSACDSALGKSVKGEGLIGLTRGFMNAGAASVMATLWRVDDEATSELMKYFYRSVLHDGLSPAAALRQAQIAMWRERRWQAPYYWASFILQGDYRYAAAPPVQMRKNPLVIAGVTIALLIMLFSYIMWTRKRRGERAV